MSTIYLMRIALILLFYASTCNHHIEPVEEACSANKSCAPMACCDKDGDCGFGPSYCSGKNCVRDCDAQPECGEFAPAENRYCPLNVCCSGFGYCGTADKFCDISCESNCREPSMPKAGGGNVTVVGGYYASWVSSRPCDDLNARDIDPRTYTHLFYAFARISGGVMANHSAQEEADLFAFTALKNQSSILKCIVSVGGWAFNDPGPTQSEFHNITSSSASRATFINSVKTFLDYYRFDGIDIDWEHPVAVERGGHPEDKDNYLLLIQEMRKAFGKYRIITITAPTNYLYLRHFKIGAMSKYLDFINLMTYDFQGIWNGNNELGTIERSHTDIRLIRDTLDLCARDGVPGGKIVIGLAYYGRSYTLAASCADNETCDFIGPGKLGPCTNVTGILSWKEIGSTIAQGLAPILDQRSMSKNLTWGNQFVWFDDEETHKYRRDFARSNGLGGFMVYSIDYASDNIQIEALPMGEMKWYQCIQYPNHCCQRSETFCLPSCKGGCLKQDIISDNQDSTDNRINFFFRTWMSELPDSLKITEMSIPGTHNSAARDVNPTAECQSMTISEQLAAGIRVLDIRCRHVENNFTIHHWVSYLGLNFGDVLNLCGEFLSVNSREMIIMRIKEEYSAKDNTRTFQETLRSYMKDKRWSSFIHATPKLGTLGDHRGKILMLSDHQCTDEFGYCWNNAKRQDYFDLSKMPSDTEGTYAMWKMEKVKQHLEDSSEDNDNLYINFSSANKFIVPTPKILATGKLASFSVFTGVNALATKLLREQSTKYKKTGLFMMDFPGSALIYQILMRN